MSLPWYTLEEADQLITPQLLFYPDRIAENIEKMLHIAGSADRLRPHIKTYKCIEIISMQMKRGIHKFKCATLAEAALLGVAKVADALIAYPLIGPSQKRLLELRKEFPETRFSVFIDSEEQLEGWNTLGEKMELFIDVNVGMNRTGASIEQALDLHRQIATSIHRFRGWHCYDGHIHTTNLQERQQEMDAAFSPMEGLIDQTGTSSSEITCGGSITFPLHAKNDSRTLSPGTTLLWDRGYGHHFPDLNFSVAAILATRIISKPDANLICLDAGYKAVASEMADAPLYFPEMPNSEVISKSEEHLVLRTSETESLQIGQLMYGIPFHICPTVALHDSVGIVENKRLTKRWSIPARNRLYA